MGAIAGAKPMNEAQPLSAWIGRRASARRHRHGRAGCRLSDYTRAAAFRSRKVRMRRLRGFTGASRYPLRRKPISAPTAAKLAGVSCRPRHCRAACGREARWRQSHRSTSVPRSGAPRRLPIFRSAKAAAAVCVSSRCGMKSNPMACLPCASGKILSSARQAAVAPPAPSARPRADLIWQVDASPVLLFRFSALTFNGHRIHYDHPYATQTEGYGGLVVHGPLQADLLLNQASVLLGAVPRRFSYRCIAPLIAGQPFEVLSARAAEHAAIRRHRRCRRRGDERSQCGAVAAQTANRFASAKRFKTLSVMRETLLS